MQRERWRSPVGGDARSAIRAQRLVSVNGGVGRFAGADLGMLGRMSISLFGGACAIDLVGPDGREHSIVSVAADEAHAVLLERVLRELQGPDLAAQVQHALRTGRTVYRSIPRTFARVADNAESPEAEENTPAWLLVPAVAVDSGVRVVLVRRGRVFGPDDVRDAEGIARLAAHAAAGTRTRFDGSGAGTSATGVDTESLAAVLHDLRTPLSAIAGYADLLLGGGGGMLTEAQKTYLERIMEGQKTLDRLLARLFDYQVARLSPATVDISRVWMPDLLSHVRSLVVPELTRKGVRCVIEAGDHAEAVVYTDPTRLNQIVLNLVTNAVKYTPPGGTVTLGLSQTPKDVTVRVTDTGAGIPADKLDAIFEPFVRLDPAVEGTGLGLAITRELTRVLGGCVEVTNSTAAGSTFAVTIPRWPAAVIPEASGGALAGPRDMPSIPR